MKIIVYKCDQCKKILSEDLFGVTHLSLKFERPSGWVSKNEFSWSHTTGLTGIRQFCNGKCLGKYFDEVKIKAEKILKKYNINL